MWGKVGSLSEDFHPSSEALLLRPGLEREARLQQSPSAPALAEGAGLGSLHRGVAGHRRVFGAPGGLPQNVQDTDAGVQITSQQSDSCAAALASA